MCRGRKGLKGRATAIPALLSIIVAGGCATQPKPAEDTPAYFHDADTCSRHGRDIAKVRIRTGSFRDDMPLALGVNRQKYAACMESLGWAAPDPARDPYFALAAKCRQSAMRSKQTAEEGRLRLRTALDETAYGECMRNNGVEGEVIVHPLEVR